MDDSMSESKKPAKNVHISIFMDKRILKNHFKVSSELIEHACT
ncbi:MAG: hypothetical protein A4E47_00462 [Methanosaeta sp. PtaU1.Bin028]|nr:MAG: hypothetical protein A4E47_00462 [Methanosaeta sp. PtaU1.Bin028]